MLVVLAEPGQLVRTADADIRVLRAQIGTAAETDVANTAGTVGKGGIHEHAAVGQLRIRRAVVAARADVDAALAENRTS